MRKILSSQRDPLASVRCTMGTSTGMLVVSPTRLSSASLSCRKLLPSNGTPLFAPWRLGTLICGYVINVLLSRFCRVIDNNATFQGLARIPYRLGTFTRYEHSPSGDEHVDAFIINTGINIRHTKFKRRVSWGKSMPQDDVNDNGNSHGVHCAGTVGSRKHGVSKVVNLVTGPVGCQSRKAEGSVANLSLGVANPSDDRTFSGFW
jgi:hypothetical protein